MQSYICFLYAIFAYKLHPYCLTRLRRFVRVVFRTFMIVQRFREHNGDRCRAESGAAKERRRIQSTEVRLHTPLVSGRMVGGTGGQAISQLQRQSLSSREYIDTSGAHWPVYNIAYRNVRAPTFRPSRTSSREKHRFTMISHRSRLWIVLKNEIIKELLAFGFLWHFYNKI